MNMFRFARAAFAATILMVAAAGSAPASIYNANVEGRLTGLNASQKAQVLKITSKSWNDSLVVFRKFGIDPNSPPEFKRLVKAASELQAIERRERAEMKKILTPDQLDEYDGIIERTHIIVRKAAQAESGQRKR